MNHSPNTPTPQAAPTSEIPFPLRASKLCLLLPVVIILYNTAIRSLGPQFPFFETQAGQLVSTAIVFLLSVAGLTLGIIALLGRRRFGGRLVPPILGILINCIFLSFLVIGFATGRAKARAGAEALRELRAEIKKETKGKTGSEAGAKAVAKIEAAAEKATGPAAGVLAAGSVVVRRIQAAAKNYEEASAKFDYDAVMDPRSSGTKEEIAAKRELVKGFIDANAKLVAVLNGVSEHFRQELRKNKLSAEEVDAATRNFTEGMKLPLQLRVREGDTILGASIMDILNLLEENLGQWEYDEANEQLVIEDDAALTKYQELIARIEAAGTDQAEAMELLQKAREAN